MKNLLDFAKIFVLALLVIIPAKVSAADYYVGNYKGAEKYLMTETIQVFRENFSDHTSVIDFYFKVKAVYKDSVQIDDYHCDFPSGVGFFEVNGRRVGRFDREHSIIESNIVDYLTKNF